MSVMALAGIVANRAGDWGTHDRVRQPAPDEVVRYRGARRTPSRAAPAQRDQSLADFAAKIVKYIPTDVAILWSAVAGSIATLNPPMPGNTKLALVVGLSIMAAFLTWVGGHIKQRSNASQVSAWISFRAGYYEILAAGVAFFMWATAMPGAWFDFGPNPWAPIVLVGTTTAVIGGLAVLLNREPS